MKFTLIDKQMNKWQNYINVGFEEIEGLEIHYDISGLEIDWEYEIADDFRGRVFNGLNDVQLDNEAFIFDDEEITEEEFFKKIEVEDSEEFFKELKKFIKKELAEIIEDNQEDFE